MAAKKRAKVAPTAGHPAVGPTASGDRFLVSDHAVVGPRVVVFATDDPIWGVWRKDRVLGIGEAWAAYEEAFDGALPLAVRFDPPPEADRAELAKVVASLEKRGVAVKVAPQRLDAAVAQAIAERPATGQTHRQVVEEMAAEMTAVEEPEILLLALRQSMDEVGL